MTLPARPGAHLRVVRLCPASRVGDEIVQRQPRLPRALTPDALRRIASAAAIEHPALTPFVRGTPHIQGSKPFLASLADPEPLT